MKLKDRYQGKIAEVIHRTKEIREIHVYLNSSDFPECQMILLTGGDHEPERVPLTEEIWRNAGIALGYRFRKQ